MRFPRCPCGRSTVDQPVKIIQASLITEQSYRDIALPKVSLCEAMWCGKEPSNPIWRYRIATGRRTHFLPAGGLPFQTTIIAGTPVYVYMRSDHENHLAPDRNNREWAPRWTCALRVPMYTKKKKGAECHRLPAASIRIIHYMCVYPLRLAL